MNVFNSLWAKISLGVVILIIAVMSMVTYIFTLKQIKMQRNELSENMGRIAKQIASIRLAETEGWYVYQDWIDNIIESDFGQDLVYIAIFNEKDSLAAFALNDSWVDLGSKIYLSYEEKIDVVEMLSSGHIASESQKDFDHQLIDIRWGNEFLGNVDVGFSLIDFNNMVRERLLINLALLTLFLFIGILGSILMSHRITRPLEKLSSAMMAVSKGNLSHTLKSRRKDEIGKLTHSFNYMISELREKAAIEKFARELKFNIEIENICQVVTKAIVAAMGAKSGSLFLIEKSISDYTASVASVHPEQYYGKKEFSIKEYCYQSLFQKKEPRPIEKLQDLPGFKMVLNSIQKSLDLKTLSLVSPLVGKEKLFGFLLLSEKKDLSIYSKHEIRFLETLIGQAALAIENALLLVELTEQERLKRELEIAHQIQKRLLPWSEPDMAGLDISGICISAAEVGGDYYDYFILDNNRIGIAIADVSGKGTSAAFYMAEIKGMMSSLVYLIESPRKLICEINQRLYNNVDRNVFATMIYAVLDLKNGILSFIRAGHNALMIKRNNPENEIELLIPPGLGLGLIDNHVFSENIQELTVNVNKGDTILFYTDGISESMNLQREEFGEENLANLLIKSHFNETDALKSHILKEINNFVQNAPQHDDLTMVIARLKE